MGSNFMIQISSSNLEMLGKSTFIVFSSGLRGGQDYESDTLVKIFDRRYAYWEVIRSFKKLILFNSG